MKSHTNLVAQQTRLSEWADLIRDCQNRPQGMKIDEWCQLHDITKVFRNYDRNQKYKTTRHKELLEEFFKYSTEFKHITSMSATAECHHISVFLDSLDSIFLVTGQC